MSSATLNAASTPTQVACAHCGLPAYASDPSQPAFCCHGCKGAYELIRGWGLDEFYQLRDAPGEDAIDVALEDALADLDDPTLLGRSAPISIEFAGNVRLLKSKLSISGLHCAACLWLIERTPERIPGWHSATVNLHDRTIDVTFDPARVALSEIGRHLSRIGYNVSPLADGQAEDAGADENRTMLIEIAIAGFCAANAMWIAIALYAGQFTGMAAAHTLLLRIAGVGLGAVAVLFPGRVFFRSAWASVLTRTPHMDLPVAVGLTAGLTASLFGLFDPESEVYFDSIACLVLFLLTGRWIQMRQQRRAGDAVEGLIRISPAAANRIATDGSVERVSVSQLRRDDCVLVNPGEPIPVDGVVIAGESLIDRSLLTGESRPVAITCGGEVEAGTENLQSTLTLRATAVGDETRLSELTSAVAEAAASRTPIVQLANRIGGWFVVVVLGLAIVTAVTWWPSNPSKAISSTVALLIVACPCALALGTPLALAVAIGRLARQRVLVRAGDCLERLDRRGTILFDKTGTLTEGRMQVTQWIGDEDAIRAAAAIESDINHPIARAIVDHASRQNVPAGCATNVQQTVGCGVSGDVDGHRYDLGGMHLLHGDSVTIDDKWTKQMESISAAAQSPVVILKDNRIVAVCSVADPIRSDAREVIDYFLARGWHVGMLSGDNPRTVANVGRSLGLASENVRGGLLPDEKLDAVRNANSDHCVVMVGDGVNDAAALAAADVGIAIQGGASASLTAAPVMIGDGKLGRLVTLVEAATQTRQSIWRNFAVSISYNVIAVVLAMCGMITPLVAAILMPLSSSTVLALTLSNRTLSHAFGAGEAPAEPHRLNAVRGSAGASPSRSEIGSAGASPSRSERHDLDTQAGAH